MELVVDANILVAGFLKSSITRELLMDERLTLWAPEYSLTEAEKVLVSERFRRRLGGLSQSRIRSLLALLTKDIRILPGSDYRPRFKEACRLAPHPEDAPYLALALHLTLPLWSNDLALKTQQKVPVYTTEELLAILQS